VALVGSACYSTEQTMDGDAGGSSPWRQPRRCRRLRVLQRQRRRPREGGGGGCGDGGEGGRPLTGEIMVERLRQIELHGNQPSWIGLCEPGLGGGRGAPPLGTGLLVATAVAVAVATSFTVRSASERREQMKRAMAGTGRLDLGGGPEIAPWKRPEEQESSRRVARDIYWNSNSWVK